MKNKIKKILSQSLISFFFPISLILRIFNFRFMRISHPKAIGHLSTEPNFYLKKVFLRKEKKYRMILCVPSKQLFSLFSDESIVDNKMLLECWKKYFFVITSSWLYLFLLPLSRSPLLRFDVVKLIDSGEYYSLYANQSLKPSLNLPEDYVKKGTEILRSWGIQENDWYVTFHCREFGYRQDLEYRYRNSDVASLDLALQEIEKRNGWCIRLGKKTDPLPEKFKNRFRIIDYSASPYLMDWMDLFLIKTSKFYIGSSNSGMNDIPILFDVPSVFVNFFPFCCPPYTKDLFISKLYFSKKENRLLSFKEILQKPKFSLQIGKTELDQLDIKILDNTPEEIREIILEMLERVNNTFCQTLEDQKFQKNFKELFSPKDYCYDFLGIAGAKFLKKYKDLL